MRDLERSGSCKLAVLAQWAAGRQLGALFINGKLLPGVGKHQQLARTCDGWSGGTLQPKSIGSKVRKN